MSGEKDMKVVHITPYYPPCKGGISSFVSGLVQNLDPPIRTHVISRDGVPSEGVTVLHVGKGMFIIKSLETLRRLKPDVIHCHSHWHMLSPAILYKRFHKDVKIFFTFHTEPSERMKKMKSGIFSRLLSKCNGVTFVSEALQKTISTQIDTRTRNVAIHPGVERREVNKEEVQEFSRVHGTEGKSPLLVFVGLLEWELKVQGIMTLLEAMAYMREEHPNIGLLLVGDGSKRSLVVGKINELGLSSHVKITGFVDNVFVPLSMCDLYVHISLQEGLPQAVLEAMSLGKPVIASRVGGIPEVVRDGETGVLVDTEKGAVASAIIELVSDETRMSRLGKNSKEFIESHLTWKKISEEFQELYSSS